MPDAVVVVGRDVGRISNELSLHVTDASVAVPCAADRGMVIRPTPRSLSWRLELTWAVVAVVPTGP